MRSAQVSKVSRCAFLPQPYGYVYRHAHPSHQTPIISHMLPSYLTCSHHISPDSHHISPDSHHISHALIISHMLRPQVCCPPPRLELLRAFKRTKRPPPPCRPSRNHTPPTHTHHAFMHMRSFRKKSPCVVLSSVLSYPG